MKKLIFIFSCLVASYSYGQLSNGGFEVYATTPGCSNQPFSKSIANCSNWSGLSCKQGNGITPNVYKSDFNSSVFYFHYPLTNSCFPGQTGSVPHGGNAMAQFRFNGSYGGITQYKEFVFQQTATLTAGKKYKISAYFDHCLCSPTLNARQIGFKLLPSSVGTTAQAILTAALDNQATYPFTNHIVGAKDNYGRNLITTYFEPSVTGTYYLLIGAFLHGDDIDNTTYPTFVDDVSMAETCEGTAGTVVASSTKICPANPSATLTVTGYMGTPQWEQKSCGGNWATISGATGPSYPVNSSNEYGISFRVRVNCNGTTVYSNIVTVYQLPACNSWPAACQIIGPKLKTGNAELEEKTAAVTIYPNPTSGQFIITTLFEEATDFTIVVFDFLGKKVYEKQMQSIKDQEELININLENQPKGIYTVKILSEQEDRMFKVIYQ